MVSTCAASMTIIPVLVATGADTAAHSTLSLAIDRVAMPLTSTAHGLRSLLSRVFDLVATDPKDWLKWEATPYRPTQTIIEAALALYTHHTVDSMARNDGGAKNLRSTSKRIEELIEDAKREHKKLMCFVR